MVSKHPVLSKKTGALVLDKTGNQLLRLLIRRIPSAVAVLDNGLRFIVVSDRFLEQSQLTYEQVTSGQHWYELIPDMPKKWRFIHNRCLNGEHLKCDEDIFYRHTGDIEWWRWECGPWYNEKNEIGGIFLNIENITKQKETEKKLKQMIRSLNECNRALAGFAHICAHDLNEPLRTIVNYSQLIERSTSDFSDVAIKGHLRTIVDNAHYMNSLVQKLLEYLKLRIRKVKREYVSMQNISVEVLKNLKTLIVKKNARITCDELPVVNVDRTLIAQVLYNLLTNAIIFNTREIPEISVKVKDCNDFWLFSVNDNGIGIESKYLNKIFLEFMRLSPKTSGSGSGVGLSQCKKIIEDHNGRIWARSIPNQGSTFYFTLPKDVPS